MILRYSDFFSSFDFVRVCSLICKYCKKSHNIVVCMDVKDKNMCPCKHKFRFTYNIFSALPIRMCMFLWEFSLYNLIQIHVPTQMGEHSCKLTELSLNQKMSNYGLPSPCKSSKYFLTMCLGTTHSTSLSLCIVCYYGKIHIGLTFLVHNVD